MTRYRNGRLPRSVLVPHRQGDVTFYSTAYVVQQWVAMVAYVERVYGITLYITTSSTSVIDGIGINMYRDVAAQWVMRHRYGLGAAKPETSSHGGTFEGQDAMAVDVRNWAILDRRFGHGTFYRIAHKFGFTPGLITRSRGYARTEKWHLVMFNPYRPAASLAGGRSAPEIEGDNLMLMIHKKTQEGTLYAIAAPRFWLEFRTGSKETSGGLARQVGGSSVEVSDSFWEHVKASATTGSNENV